LSHAQGKSAEAAASYPLQPDLIQHLVDAAPADPDAQRQAAQMVIRAASAVRRPPFHQRADLE
jgi:hypothetical protein